jgi:hypothetical protein
MNTYQTIRFRFIRDGQNPKDDDTTKFEPVFKDNGQFDYFHVTELIQVAPAGRRNKTITHMSNYAFTQWLSSVLIFSELDTEDPLEFIQIEMPLLPQILIRPTQLRNSWNTITNWLLCLLEPGVWPKVTEDILPPNRPNRRVDISPIVQPNLHQNSERQVRRHTFFDEDGGMRVIARFV